MKTGANFTDVNRIKRLSEAGWDAAAISKAVLVDVEVVKNFMPRKRNKPGPKPKNDAVE